MLWPLPVCTPSLNMAVGCDINKCKYAAFILVSSDLPLPLHAQALCSVELALIHLFDDLITTSTPVSYAMAWWVLFGCMGCDEPTCVDGSINMHHGCVKNSCLGAA